MKLQEKEAAIEVSLAGKMAALARRHALEEEDARQEVEKRCATELMRAKLALKQKHYKQFAEALKSHKPDAEAVQSAEEQAERLAKLRMEMEKKETGRQRRLEEEMRQFEAEQRAAIKEQLSAFRAELEAEEEADRARHAKQLENLERRRAEFAEDRKAKIEAERARLTAEGVPEDEQRRLLAKLQEEADRTLARMDGEKRRMQSNLEQRLRVSGEL